MLNTTYLDANRPDWQIEDINTLVAWTHEDGPAEYRALTDGEFRTVIMAHDVRALASVAWDNATVVTGTYKKRAIAREVISVADRGAGYDMTKASNRALLPLVVAAGVMPAEAQADMLALALLPTRSNWLQAGGSNDTVDDASRTTILSELRA